MTGNIAVTDARNDLPNLKSRALQNANKNDERMETAFRNAVSNYLENEYDVWVRHGQEHYSWDCPGASKQNDLPSGGQSIAKDGSEHVFVTIEDTSHSGLSQELKMELVAIADRFDCVVRDCGYRIALYPTWDTVRQ